MSVIIGYFPSDMTGSSTYDGVNFYPITWDRNKDSSSTRKVMKFSTGIILNSVIFSMVLFLVLTNCLFMFHSVIFSNWLISSHKNQTIRSEVYDGYTIYYCMCVRFVIYKTNGGPGLKYALLLYALILPTFSKCVHQPACTTNILGSTSSFSSVVEHSGLARRCYPCFRPLFYHSHT